MVSLFPHPASFRFHLAMDTLAFGCILPTAGRIRVFHPSETCAAGRTTEKRPSFSLKKSPACPGHFRSFPVCPSFSRNEVFDRLVKVFRLNRFVQMRIQPCLQTPLNILTN